MFQYLTILHITNLYKHDKLREWLQAIRRVNPGLGAEVGLVNVFDVIAFHG